MLNGALLATGRDRGHAAGRKAGEGKAHREDVHQAAGHREGQDRGAQHGWQVAGEVAREGEENIVIGNEVAINKAAGLHLIQPQRHLQGLQDD